MNIKILLSLLFGEVNAPKTDLRKRQTREDRLRGLNCFFERNFYTLTGLAIIFLLIIFVAVCFLLVGSCTDSGVTYNQMRGVI